MGNESRRIDIKIGDDKEKNIKFKLDQNVKTMEILSLKLTQEDIFKSYNADYGVVIGRVIGNGAVGIPNAKVSIFIPLDSVDESNPIIKSIYPYKKPQDKNLNNKRYNLLPRTQKNGKPRQPFGSFPSKEEVLCNNEYLTVYEKYYKYSTVTNSSGDYMIFGVPIGSQIIHMSVDITDIGSYSMSPISMVTNLGYSPNLFSEGGTKIKEAEDLTELPNIETQDISLNVIPFWGDVDNFDIGITRQDFKIRAEITPEFTIFGSCITHGANTCIGNPILGEDTYFDSHDSGDGGFYFMTDINDYDVRANRLATPKIDLLTYDVNKIPDLSIVNDSNYNNLNSDWSDKGELIVVDKNGYAKIIKNGEFALVVKCNRKKMITDANGVSIEVEPNNVNGVFTEFAGSILIEADGSDNKLPINLSWFRKFYYNKGAEVRRGRLKIPQGINGENLTHYSDANADKEWRKSYSLFKGGEYYSISQFYPTKWIAGINTPDNSGYANNVTSEAFFTTPKPNGGLIFKVAGDDNLNQSDVDQSNYSGGDSTTGSAGNTNTFGYDMIPNIKFDKPAYVGDIKYDGYFGAQWLNMCLMFPQYVICNGVENGNNDGHRDQKANDMTTLRYMASDYDFTRNDQRRIVGNIFNYENFLRPSAFQTDFINVSKNDIDVLSNSYFSGLKGINKYSEGFIYGNAHGVIDSIYKYRPMNQSGGAQEYDLNAMDNVYSGGTETQNGYIFKGMYNTDCIALLKNNGLI